MTYEFRISSESKKGNTVHNNLSLTQSLSGLALGQDVGAVNTFIYRNLVTKTVHALLL